MPLCDVRCSKCGHEEEVLIKFHEKHNKKCNSCGKNSVERLISGGTHAFLKGEIKTLGQLAEKNNKEKGRYYEQKEREKEVRIDSLGRENIRHKYVPSEIDYALLEATPQEKQKYIYEGKKPAKKSQKTKQEKIAEIKERKKIK